MYRPAYMFLRLPHRPLCQFMRFKLGCHSLATETGRWHGTPHIQRMCQRCTQRAFRLQDERHLMFDCPALEDSRRQHCQSFDSEVVASLDTTPACSYSGKLCCISDIQRFVGQCCLRLHEQNKLQPVGTVLGWLAMQCHLSLHWVAREREREREILHPCSQPGWADWMEHSTHS